MVSPKEYMYFADMSEYSYGTDFFLKVTGMLSTSAHVENVISFLYTILFKTISLYCPEYIDDNYNKFESELFYFFMKKKYTHFIQE